MLHLRVLMELPEVVLIAEQMPSPEYLAEALEDEARRLRAQSIHPADDALEG